MSEVGHDVTGAGSQAVHSSGLHNQREGCNLWSLFSISIYIVMEQGFSNVIFKVQILIVDMVRGPEQSVISKYLLSNLLTTYNQNKMDCLPTMSCVSITLRNAHNLNSTIKMGNGKP